jgi:membrane protease YdiL (CAAX protease family)
MSTQEMTATNNLKELSIDSQTGQYSLRQILGIWALAALPMGILAWVVYPSLSPDFSSDPLGAGVTIFVLLTAGLIWLFVLSMIIVRKEEGDLRWATVKRRLRLNAPQDPRTGEARRRLWLWVIPFIIGNIVWGVAITPIAEKIWVSVFPFLAEAPGHGSAALFESQEILQQLVGAWWFFGLLVVFSIFNVLGEEFLFRGVLLPRMQAVFGKWSWVANGMLSAFYHLHQPWTIAANVLQGAFLLAFPRWRFRSTWMSVIVHSVENVVGGILTLGIILGLA